MPAPEVRGDFATAAACCAAVFVRGADRVVEDAPCGGDADATAHPTYGPTAFPTYSPTSFPTVAMEGEGPEPPCAARRWYYSNELGKCTNSGAVALMETASAFYLHGAVTRLYDSARECCAASFASGCEYVAACHPNKAGKSNKSAKSAKGDTLFDKSGKSKAGKSEGGGLPEAPTYDPTALPTYAPTSLPTAPSAACAELRWRFDGDTCTNRAPEDGAGVKYGSMRECCEDAFGPNAACPYEDVCGPVDPTPWPTPPQTTLRPTEPPTKEPMLSDPTYDPTALPTYIPTSFPTATARGEATEQDSNTAAGKPTFRVREPWMCVV